MKTESTLRIRSGLLTVTMTGILCALSLVLVTFIHFPIFPRRTPFGI